MERLDAVRGLHDHDDPEVFESYDGTREFSAFAQRAATPSPRRVLCVGSNVAEVRFFERFGSVTDIDISEVVLSRIRTGTSARTIHESVLEYSTSERFDLIWACRSLIQLSTSELRDAIELLRELLEPDGRLAIVLILGDESCYESDLLRRIYARSDLPSIFDGPWEFVHDDDDEPCACALIAR